MQISKKIRKFFEVFEFFCNFAAKLLCNVSEHTLNPSKYNFMKRHFLPEVVAIAMTKSQFCFCTGCTPYNLRKLLNEKSDKYERLGVRKWDKLLMPAAVRELCHDTGLRIDVDYYLQYIRGQRGEQAIVAED